MKPIATEPTIVQARPEDLRLLPDEDNPNRMSKDDYRMLVEEIQTYGFLQPPLAREAEDGVLDVIDGAHRVRGAMELALASIPVVVIKAGDDHALALTIAMNKLRGSLDLTKVARSANKLLDTYGWDPSELKLTGYEREDIDALVASTKKFSTEEVLAGAASTDFDEAEKDPQEEYDANPKPFVLELTFATSEELKKVKKGLRKAAGGGRGADMARGLVRLLEGA